MMEQIYINNLASLDDFDLYIREREITIPTKKSIIETVPYSNITYDFSKLDDEIFWENRELKYSFDIAELSTSKMEHEKSRILDWLLNVQETKIYDSSIKDFHFFGSYSSSSWSEDFGSGTFGVVFSVYPYKISNKPKIQKFTIDGADEVAKVYSSSSHPVKANLIIDGTISIIYKNMQLNLGTGTYQNYLSLAKGSNTFLLGGNGTITFEFVEEVL